MTAKKRSDARKTKIERASRRYFTQAVQPGSLEDASPLKGGSDLSRLYAHRILQLCDHVREQMPPFRRDTRALDKWLISTMDDEKTGFLSSFIDQAAMIQSNRNYFLVGPKRTVRLCQAVLNGSELGDGFRRLLKLSALNYYCSNFGAAVRLQRKEPVSAVYLSDLDVWEWHTPPVTSLFATDPTGFTPSSSDDYIYPYDYFGTPWSRLDFFRVNSMPSTQVNTWGVGRSPLYRCIQIARMTSAIYEYIFDLVSPDTAKGIITVQGMGHNEFLQAVFGSESVNEQDALFKDGSGEAIGDIIVLADRDEEIKVKFVTLGRLPEGFFLDQWVRWTLTAFATNLGFPLEEFIGMPSSRLLGQSGSEVEAGQQRGASKGGAEFVNQFQEQMQQFVLPSVVRIEFADRDAAEELTAVTLMEKKAKIVTNLFTATQLEILDRQNENQDTLLEARAGGSHIITADEARRLLVEWGVLPEWFTPMPDNVPADSRNLPAGPVARLREKMRDTQQIRKLAAEAGNLPDDQVVCCMDFKDESGFFREREIVLWDSTSDLTGVHAWAGVGDGSWREKSKPVARALEQGEINLNYVFGTDHISVMTKVLFDNAGNEKLSQKDKETLTSRLYAVTQLGRNSVTGNKEINSRVSNAISDRLLRFVSDVVSSCLVTERESFGDMPDDGLLNVKQALPAWLEIGHDKPTVRNMAEMLATKAYHAGVYVTGDEVGVKTKRWIAGCDAHDSGETVKFNSKFGNGEFWAGYCGCEVACE